MKLTADEKSSILGFILAVIMILCYLFNLRHGNGMLSHP